MKDFDALLNIWNEQKNAPAVDYKSVMDNFKRSKNSFRTKLWVELAAMLLIMAALIGLWIQLSFQLWTSNAALLIFVGCCLFYVYTQVKNLKVLKSESILQTPEKHISSLQNFRIERRKQNSKNYYFYVSAISLAFGLYFIEFFREVSLWTLLASVIFCITWVVICTVVIRKFYMKNEEKRFDEMLAELQRLQRQFEE